MSDRIFINCLSLHASHGVMAYEAHLAPFTEDRGISHATAVSLFTLVGLGSTFGRFLLGALADRLGRRRSFAAMYLGMALMLVWWLNSWSAWQIAVFALVFGTFYGGCVALAPALIVRPDRHFLHGGRARHTRGITPGRIRVRFFSKLHDSDRRQRGGDVRQLRADVLCAGTRDGVIVLTCRRRRRAVPG